MKTFIDIETTGLEKHKCDIIQVACIKTSDDAKVVLSRDMFLLRCEITPEIEKITGLTNTRLMKDGLYRGEFVKRLRDLLEGNPTFVGHNIATFDWPFIVAFLERHIEFFPTCPIGGLIDTLGMTREIFSLRKWPKNREAAFALGIEYDEELLHDAEYDIELTRKVYLGLEVMKRATQEERRKCYMRMSQALAARNLEGGR